MRILSIAGTAIMPRTQSSCAADIAGNPLDARSPSPSERFRRTGAWRQYSGRGSPLPVRGVMLGL